MRNFKMGNMRLLLLAILVSACSENGGEDGLNKTTDLGISPKANADDGSSFMQWSSVDLHIWYSSIPRNNDVNGTLQDAIAYLDANGDGITDVFMATGEYLIQDERDCILAINDGTENFTSSTEEFNGDMPPATHARKSIVADFDNDGLQDIFVFDHGYDANPFPGSTAKLMMQYAVGSFSWVKMPEVGFFHTGAAADIDNDGDIDIFMGGHDPFFYINDGDANFEAVTDRFDGSMDKVFTAELIDVDQDGYVDLLVAAHEQDGDETSIYWGNSSGSFTKSNRTVLPAVEDFGVVLDFDAADFDGDGDRDLVINRTGDNPFYTGAYLQLLINDGGKSFSDATGKIDDPGNSSESWFPWIRVQDYDNDGDIDVFSDNVEVNRLWINDGQGNFTRGLLY